MLSMKTRMAFLVAATIAALALAAAAVAGTITATATVSGAGSMSITGGSSASMSDTLDGTDQTASWSVPFNVTDARGTGAGWNLTITSTTFTDGNGDTLPTSASQIGSVAAVCVNGGTCSSPTNAVSYPIAVPAGTTAPAAVKFFNAATSTGMGRFTVTPTVNVSIPGNSFAGTYTSTVTIAAVSGP
jgi:hypothetical protein